MGREGVLKSQNVSLYVLKGIQTFIEHGCFCLFVFVLFLPFLILTGD